MAITNNKQPSAFSPVGNQLTFESTSNQIAMTDFMYRIIVTDILSGESQTFNIKKRPTTSGEMIWNARVFAYKFVKDYIPNNLYGWQVCTDGRRTIRVNVGEYYSGTYHAGSNYDFVVWNGSLRPLDWVNYSSADYVYESASNKVCLNEVTNNKTYLDRSEFVYIMGGSTASVGVEIYTYDVYGNFLTASQIANGAAGKYNCIDIGLKGLAEISPGDVTGTYPIIGANVSYYEVKNNSLSGEIFKTLTIDSECLHDIFTLHYKSNTGAFETLHCTKVSIHEEVSEKTTYRVDPNELVSNTYSYSAFSQWEKTLSSSSIDSYTINTDWMTNEQVAWHRQVVTSPLVYMDMGSSIGLIPVKVNASTALVNKDWNNTLYGMTLNITPTYKNIY
jgi:hypothetical protein